LELQAVNGSIENLVTGKIVAAQTPGAIAMKTADAQAK